VTNVETAKTLSFIGAILSMVFGVIYLLWGIALVAIINNTYYNINYLGWAYVVGLGLPWMIYGTISLIFGILTLTVARKNLVDASTLKSGAIMCFIFGGISAGAIGGIVTIVAGILSIMAWDEQRKAAEAPPPPPPNPPIQPAQQGKPEVAATRYCKYCGAEQSSDATFCSSCGKKLKK
jgi:vacuolar-type H+-ATPase subunit I/STV1